MLRTSVIIIAFAGLLYLVYSLYSSRPTQQDKIKSIHAQFGTMQNIYNTQPSVTDPSPENMDKFNEWDGTLQGMDKSIRGNIAQIQQPQRDSLLAEFKAFKLHNDSIAHNRVDIQMGRIEN